MIFDCLGWVAGGAGYDISQASEPQRQAILAANTSPEQQARMFWLALNTAFPAPPLKPRGIHWIRTGGNTWRVEIVR